MNAIDRTGRQTSSPSAVMSGGPPAVRPATSVAEEAGAPPASSRAIRYQPIALVDLLDRVLAGGVVISGEVTLSIADIDMVTVSLRALISSVSTAFGHDPSDEARARD